MQVNPLISLKIVKKQPYIIVYQ